MSTSVVVVTYLAIFAFFCSFVIEINSAPNGEPKDEGPVCQSQGVKYKPGDTWSGPVGDCSTYECAPNGKDVQRYQCTDIHVLGGASCTITPYDFTLQYPGCCPNVTCTEQPDELTAIFKDVETEIESY